MPRHAIRKPKADLALGDLYCQVDDLPQSITSQTCFGNDRPLEVEIGSGKGLFITTASLAHRRHNFLGIEIIDKYARHSAARLLRGGSDRLGNARMVAGDAQPLFASKIPPESLEAVHVYFPDPWWKKKHRKRRVINTSSITAYARSLRVGGRLHFWTDVLDYFEDTIEMIAELSPQLGVPIPEEEIESSHDLDYRTHFERRSRQHNIPVYRVRYDKRR